MSRSHRLAMLFAIAVVVLHVHDAQAKRRAVLSPAPRTNNLFTEGGYADRASVAQGESIGLHIATSVTPFTLNIVNLAQPDQPIRTLGNVQSHPQDCSGRYTQGCGWAVTTTLDIPRQWSSGFYAAVFPTAFGLRYIPFIVREDVPGSASPIVVLASTHTWQAYNEFGGRSSYPSDDPLRATQVTYDRPYLDEDGLGRFAAFEKPFVDWMTSEGRPFEVITDVDLEDPAILARYTVLVIPGHSEYWTAAARNTVEQFSGRGGHIAILNGNTMWWQVRLEQQGRLILAYKGYPVDPAVNTPFFSTHFFSDPVNEPENRLIGTSYRNGGFANRVSEDSNEMKPVEERTPWTVTDSSHWIFNGTGLQEGDTFGQETTGLEVDGVIFNCDANGKILGPEGSDETPLNYEILAITPASEGWGTMGLLVHPSGGAVFNAATNSWNWALASNATVRMITRNVLDRFRTGAPLPYEPVQSTLYAQDLFNCPQPVPLTGWESTSLQTRPQVTAGCAREGAGGLELAGDGERGIARYIAPRGGASRNEAHIRLYIKADELQQRTTFPMAILGLEEQAGLTRRRAAFIEVDATDGKRIRVARRPSAGGFAASDWIPLADGWHLVEVSWRSPGTMSLQVDGGNAVTLDNPDADQRVNRVVLSYPQPELTTAGRLCIDDFAIGSTKPTP